MYEFDDTKQTEPMSSETFGEITLEKHTRQSVPPQAPEEGGKQNKIHAVLTAWKQKWAERATSKSNPWETIQNLREQQKDGRVISLIHKFLRAPISEEGKVGKANRLGCPQGVLYLPCVRT